MADIEITNQYASKQDIYSWFETDDFPTEAQFRATWDSYWHKSESIPMDSISGLVAKFNQTVSKSTFESHLKDEDAHVTTLAKIDASNINVRLWKQTLGVGALPANIATIDYTDGNGNALEGNAYKKVENPNDGNVYVLNIDGTKVNANTFGKNITNSSNTTNGSYVQTQRVGDTWSWDTNGQSYAIKNLPNKSADASFDRLFGRNSQGQMAEVNGKTVFINIPSNLSPAEKKAWLTQMNDNISFTGSTISSVNPPVIQKMEANQYLVISGLGLNLNPSNSYIAIQNTETDEEIVAINKMIVGDGKTVIAQLPPTNSFPAGNYKVLLNNVGIPAVGDIYVVLSNTLVDIPGFQTFVKKLNDSTSTAISTDGIGNISMKADGTIIPYMTGVSGIEIIGAAYSTQILKGSEDWTISVLFQNSGGSFGDGMTTINYFGFTAGDGTNLNPTSVLYSTRLVCNHMPGAYINFALDGLLSTPNLDMNVQFRITYSKKANLLSATLEGKHSNGSTVGVVATIIIDETKDYRFKAIRNNSGVNATYLMVSPPKYL